MCAIGVYVCVDVVNVAVYDEIVDASSVAAIVVDRVAVDICVVRVPLRWRDCVVVAAGVATAVVVVVAMDADAADDSVARGARCSCCCRY